MLTRRIFVIDEGQAEPSKPVKAGASEGFDLQDGLLVGGVVLWIGAAAMVAPALAVALAGAFCFAFFGTIEISKRKKAEPKK